MLTTPLQLAVMTARLANGGFAVQPLLVGSINRQKVVTPPPAKIPVSAAHLKIVLDGMYDVVNDRRGTAYAARIPIEGLEMSGKTGTAQVKRITMAERAAGIKNENLPWKFRHHALFVGYAPIENPKYACAVVVEHGVGGSKTAAPLARDLLIAAQEKAAQGRIVHGLPAAPETIDNRPDG
jgi:penicillin-binding protein 2